MADQNARLARSLLEDSSSDEEALEAALFLIGEDDTAILLPGTASKEKQRKAANIDRNFKEAASRIEKDYFGSFDAPPLYSERSFETRFRMPRSVFEKLREKIFGHDVFVRCRDALGKEGLFPIQRMAAAVRMFNTLS